MALAKREWLLGLTLAGTAIFSGCGDSEAPPAASDPPIPYAESLPEETGASKRNVPESTSDPGTAREREFPGIALTVPASWTELPNQGFVDAKYLVPHPEGEMELTLTTMGGGIDPNVDRWVGQFQVEPGDAPQRESLLIDGVDARWIDVRGTFHSRVSGNPGPHENWAMLGVAIPNRPKDFYIKLTGPRDAIVGFRDAFREFLQTIQIDH